ncbi:MAG TPA: LysM domain-containing protein, partial [Opitutaceae bacterium]
SRLAPDRNPIADRFTAELRIVSDLKDVFIVPAHVTMNRSLRFGLLPLALALAGALRADDTTSAAPATAPAADEVTALRTDNKQLTVELAASWKETDKLKADIAAAEAAASKNATDMAELKSQLDAAKSQPAPAPAAVPDNSATLADTQDKLATSLRSFSVLQDEDAALRAQVDKLTSDNASLTLQLNDAHSSISSLQVQAAATSQIDPLRTELRQAQDEASQLANENSQLKTRLSLQGVGPSSLKPVPTRPGTAAAALDSAPVAPTPTPTPEVKTYVVVDGDTLTRISRKFYGNSGRWEDILKANRDVMKDEKSLVVGSTIKIP